jgi:hypothetical protein
MVNQRSLSRAMQRVNQSSFERAAVMALRDAIPLLCRLARAPICPLGALLRPSATATSQLVDQMIRFAPTRRKLKRAGSFLEHQEESVTVRKRTAERRRPSTSELEPAMGRDLFADITASAESLPRCISSNQEWRHAG